MFLIKFKIYPKINLTYFTVVSGVFQKEKRY